MKTNNTGGVLLGILSGGVPPGSRNIILTLFQPKKLSFSTPVFRPGFSNPYSFSDLQVVTKSNITCLHKTEIMSSLLRLKPQQKDFLKTISKSPRATDGLSNSHSTLSSLFIWNWFDEHIDTQLRFLRKHTRFQTKTAQRPYPWGRHIPKWLIYGSTPRKQYLSWSITAWRVRLKGCLIVMRGLKLITICILNLPWPVHWLVTTCLWRLNKQRSVETTSVLQEEREIGALKETINACSLPWCSAKYIKWTRA